MNLIIGQIYKTQGTILGQPTTKSVRVLGLETDEDSGEELVVVDMAPFAQRDEFEEPFERTFSLEDFEASIVPI